ncbi:putative sesquiterpene synthase [Bienertia sinuspersici]
MKENNIFDEEHVYQVLEEHVEDEWKSFNEEILRPYKVPRPLLDRLMYLNCATDVFYKGRTDGYTIVNEIIQDKIAAVLIHPILI